MQKSLILGIVSVVVGTVVGMLLMSGLHEASTLIYPAPEGLDLMDPSQTEAAQAWLRSLPAGAFLLAAVSHWCGAGSGAAVAMLIRGRDKLLWARIIGGIFTVAGLANIMMMPHPGWFPFVDLPGYIIFAEIVGRILVRRPA